MKFKVNEKKKEKKGKEIVKGISKVIYLKLEDQSFLSGEF